MATWSDRGAELWGSWGFVGNTCSSSEDDSPYPSPNANSPRVRYTDLELDSDLTLGNGDIKIGSGTTIGLGMGMSDLGEPPVSAGFTEEVALSRRGCSFVKLLRSMVLVEVRKPSASQLRQPRSSQWFTTGRSLARCVPLVLF